MNLKRLLMPFSTVKDSFSSAKSKGETEAARKKDIPPRYIPGIASSYAAQCGEIFTPTFVFAMLEFFFFLVVKNFF
jgi:hypothetical protein